ncbi:endonuclease/exonuclease/phosphatase family protein [Streptomyces sp. AK04-3B]|uniref:endonuclease/exonuclease/phosphatase family protein n=1 Tax=unclassified Streptomyces TaxID=2593676 RepID=UPI0029B7C08A|nr:endonuclease/exonuclease/phosphatase family protein [Streptomyces sp. AK04-3B]MDX3802520.1 endonuclease/exonuclease/phosphatase family protein [Streptomyces sp. AK04-3B]
MSIRIATFNMENLFRRPTAFRIEDPAKRKEILDDFATLVALLDLPVYTDDDKKKIAGLVEKHRAYDIDPKDPPPIYVNQSRPGKDSGLFKTTGTGKNTRVEVTAKGRAAWAGWAELGQDDFELSVVRNTGRVVSEVDADILLTVEVEDRLTLERFNTQVLAGALGRRPYPYALLIDGNDPRGIDVGILSRHPITSVRSHLFDTDPERPDLRLFSRDCPEFEIRLNGTPLVVLGNHLKSKFQDNPGLRLAQAERVAEIYRAALERTPHVVVAGDLNDDPDSDPATVLRDTGLRDVMSHHAYRGLPGTHGECRSERDKLDYILLSPELWPQVQHVGLETRGIFAKDIKSFDTVTSKGTAASDHAALYVDVDL